MDHELEKMGGQSHDTMNVHKQQPDSSKSPPLMPGMVHGQSSASAPSAHDMGAMNRSDGEMDHDDMRMQGGSAPPDARDPNAYSEGYVRNAGKYALPPSEALVMSDMHNFGRSEEHTSELQSIMRISSAVFCLQKKNTQTKRSHK